MSALRNGFSALGRWLGDLAQVESRSELQDRVNDTSAMPPFPGPLDTRGIDGLPYAQLEADLWTYNRHKAAGGTWSTLARTTRERLWRVYPEYLAAATRQRIAEAAAAAEVRGVSQAWGYWIRRWGDPMIEARVRLEGFLRNDEATP